MKGSLEEIDVQSAKDKLILSFRQLVIIKEFEKLTVAEICEKANVSRKTFYTHFKDKNDIIEQIVLHSISQPFKEMRMLYTLHDLPSTLLMEWLYQRIYEDKEFYANISSFTGQNSLQEFVLKHTTEMLETILESVDMSEVDKEYTVYFYAASHTLLLIKWICDGMIVSPKKMAGFYDKWTIPIWQDFSQNKKR
ncbi:TetR/AcrR family transcriptional regulator [Peribacillus psychrosaccharolyticus]|uniref:TetR/AcrR family transcriptional regulator n=1 Tax=Peribacillus psychrosaccharolyticus TaxID=1407 RepID=UPI003D2C8817